MEKLDECGKKSGREIKQRVKEKDGHNIYKEIHRKNERERERAKISITYTNTEQK